VGPALYPIVYEVTKQCHSAARNTHGADSNSSTHSSLYWVQLKNSRKVASYAGTQLQRTHSGAAPSVRIEHRKQWRGVHAVYAV
jgi:hypothetical protein